MGPDGDRYAVWTGAEVLNWGDTCCYGTGGRPFTARAWRYTPPELNKRQPTTLEARARDPETPIETTRSDEAILPKATGRPSGLGAFRRA